MLKLNFKKTRILSAVLALSTFGTVANVPNVSAGECDSFKSKPSSFIEKIKSGTKKFKKEHPKLLKAGIGIGGTILGVGALALGAKIAQEVYLRDVTTAVDNMSDKQVKAELKNQIEIFKNHDRNIFVIEDELIKKAHPRLLLIILMKINRLFEVYPAFAQKIKNRKITFNLGLIKEGFFKDLSTWAYVDITGVHFSKFYLSHLKLNFVLGKSNINSNFHSPGELDQIIERLTAHEMAHVLQFLILSTNICKKIDVYKKMKDDIIKIAKEEHRGTSEVISRYGETNEKEWFAEAFAHAECCNNPNPIGLATKDYIEELFKKNLEL